MHYIKLHALGGFTSSFAGPWYPLTALFHAANMLNTHEDLRSRLTTWMVSGFVPHLDPEIAKYPKVGGNSISVRNVELMAQCSDCLFEGWNETYADPLPMEFADGKTRLTHVVAALSISDQQEADKLLGDPLSCHVCTVPDSHYLTPEVTFPVKTAPSILKKVLDAAGGKEQVTKFGNVENFLAMAEIVHKVHIKGPHNLTNRSDVTGPGLLKVSERKEAMRMLLEGYQGM